MEKTLYFLDNTFWNSPPMVILFLGSIFMIVLLRYLILSAGYQWFVTKKFRQTSRWFAQSSPAQWRKEIVWSTLSALVFTILGAATFWMYQSGFTRIYIDLHEHSVLYFIFSVIVFLAGYETYYYWLHRWMHRPGIYQHVHKVHHNSVHTSVFTSFSFHPLEAVLQFLFIPLMVIIIPIHYYAIGIVLMLMTVSAIINHASVEIFPRNFHKNRIGKWLIGSTHHDLHHKEFRNNFGLYLTFWDRLMKTESKNFEARFHENTRQREDSTKQSVNQSQ